MDRTEKVLNIASNFASVIGAAAGIFGAMSDPALRKEPRAVADGLRNAADFLTHSAENLERQTIEDDPISTASRLSGFGLSKILDSLSTADPKFSPEELLTATADALARGAISLDGEAGVPGVSVITPDGKYGYDGEEPADVVILLNTTAVRSIDTKVLIAINSSIDVASLTVSKHVLIFGCRALADKTNIANGFIAADRLDLGDCKMNNVQFCTPTEMRIDGKPVKGTKYDLESVQCSYQVFANALISAITDHEPAKTVFEKKEGAISGIKDMEVIPFGFPVEAGTANDGTEEVDTSELHTQVGNVGKAIKPLLDSEWEIIGKMTNKKLSSIVAGFLSPAHTGETKKELIAQLKVLAITIPSIAETLRKDLEHAEAVDDVVVGEAASAAAVQDFLTGKADTPFEGETVSEQTDKN